MQSLNKQVEKEFGNDTEVSLKRLTNLKNQFTLIITSLKNSSQTDQRVDVIQAYQ